MRISVDTTRCVGAGQCVLSAPDLFEQDDNGLVIVLSPTVGADGHEAAMLAADLCPSGAIQLRDDA